jgi:hypothetical protein
MQIQQNNIRIQSASPFKRFREIGCFTYDFKSWVGLERDSDCRADYVVIVCD